MYIQRTLAALWENLSRCHVSNCCHLFCRESISAIKTKFKCHTNCPLNQIRTESLAVCLWYGALPHHLSQGSVNLNKTNHKSSDKDVWKPSFYVPLILFFTSFFFVDSKSSWCFVSGGASDQNYTRRVSVILTGSFSDSCSSRKSKLQTEKLSSKKIIRTFLISGAFPSLV